MINSNWNIIGHRHTTEFLDKLLVTSHRPHAYLFYGKPNIGKTTLVYQYIKRLMCLSLSDGNATTNLSQIPCGSCIHCEQKYHPDIQILQRLTDEKTGKLKKNISIEQIRALQTQLRKGSFLNNYNCGIIEQADYLSDAAANSLLKLLEEPPRKTLLFLIADSLTSLPPTIFSRCQIIHLSPVSLMDIESALLAKGSDVYKAKRIARFSNGAPGIAFSLNADTKLQEEYDLYISDVIRLIQMPLYERFQFVAEQLKAYKGVSAQLGYIQRLVEACNTVLRDLLLLIHGVSEDFRTFYKNEELEALQSKYTSNKISKLIMQNKRFLNSLHKNINPQLAIENILISL